MKVMKHNSNLKVGKVMLAFLGLIVSYTAIKYKKTRAKDFSFIKKIVGLLLILLSNILTMVARFISILGRKIICIYE